jgi:hypothetical protein
VRACTISGIMSRSVYWNEVLIRDYCGRNGITIQEQQALLLEAERKP